VGHRFGTPASFSKSRRSKRTGSGSVLWIPTTSTWPFQRLK
jgi:hypothetical protein